MLFGKQTLRLGFSLILAFCLGVASATAQTTTGTLLGVVQDKSGAVIPKAQVSAANEATGFSREAAGGASGEYTITLLPAGRYTVTIQAPGFKTKTLQGVVLDIDQKARLDVTLDVGNMSEKVTVEGEAALVRTETAEIGEVIENKRIVELPLNGRQFLQLAQLTPGVTTNSTGGYGQQLSGVTGPRITVMGAREDANHFTLDGVEIADRMFNSLSASPAVDAIQEFKVQSYLYSAESGGYGGAQINIAIKSGSNGFHGTAYEFFRNNVLDARNFFDGAQTQPFRQNQYGVTFGGPVKRDKTFFFANFEGLNIRKALSGTFAVPNAQVRTGNFAGLAVIKDPTTGLPFPNNQIPSGRIPAYSQALVSPSLVPLPNTSAPGILFGAPSEMDDIYQGNVRIDHRFSDKDTLFGRLSIYDATTLQPFGFLQSATSPLSVPGFGLFVNFRSTNAAIGETHVFRPNLVGELRMGFNRTAGGQSIQNAGIEFDSQNGILGTTRDPVKEGYPRIVTGIYNTWGDAANPITRRDNDFQYNYNLSWVHGTHNWKFGTEFTRIQFNPDIDPASRGQFTFTGLYTGNAMADLLLGTPASAIGATGTRLIYLRANQWHFFAQDDWKVTRRLTLNIGVRYEYDSPFSEIHNRLSALDPVGNQLIIASENGNTYPQSLWVPGIQALIPIPIVTSEKFGINNALVNKDLFNIDPRFGFAYDLFGNQRTVIRGGYGIFTDQNTLSSVSTRSSAPPFFNNVSATNSTTSPIPLTTILTNPLAGVPSWSGMDFNFKAGNLQQWSLNVQQALRKDLLVELRYAGSKGTHLLTNNSFNVPPPGPGPIASRRPFPEFGPGATAASWAVSSYNAMIARMEKRFSKGLLFVANYTFSKCIDDDSLAVGTVGTSPPADPRNFKAEKGLCTFDARHRFVFSGTYDIPSPRTNPALRALLGGWQIGSIVTLQTGLPLSVNLTSDPANTGSLNQRPNLNGNPNDFARSPQQWFNTSDFTYPAPFTFGNAGRDILEGPGTDTWDLSLLKNMHITEHQAVQFRFEAFNFLNHTNLDFPVRFCTAATAGAVCTAPTFGRILSAEPPRIIQFALKYSF